MRLLFAILYGLLSCFWSRSSAHPTLAQPRPLVIWHGLGDTYNAPGITQFMQSIKDVYPGIFIHSVYLNEDGKEDRKAGWFGNVNQQVFNVSQQLSDISELEQGFDAIGFSQGGQFLRAYVERYNSPPVHNLITFGSQHMGISDIPACRPFDVLCQLARRAAKGGVYGEWAQENLVQAQYYRDPDQLPLYLERNQFLPSINNEVDDSMNATYAKNLASLSKLVLVLFSKDTTVVPKESSWFGSYAPQDKDGRSSTVGEKTIIPMRLQTVYTEDRFGLKTLDERGDVLLETCEAEHMQITPECLQPLVQKYVGGSLSSSVPGDLLRVQ